MSAEIHRYLLHSTDDPEKGLQSYKNWASHPFYSPDSVVLGIDIGIQGIGICIRKGKEILYCKSLLVDLPEAKALANRRAFRAARRARKNRRTRMLRLKKLFAVHHLPWVDDNIMRRSDPFLLRHRATTKKLASKEALSICVRSLVLHRGYDYDVLKEQGRFPWGESSSLSEAKKWLATAFVDEKLAGYILRLEEELTEGKGNPLKDASRNELHALIEARKQASSTEDINSITAAYATGKMKSRKARGMNYPRAMVESCLGNILERHRDMIDDFDGFVKALFRPCKTKEDKATAIFHYNRKTAEEAREHFNKKVKDCPLGDWLEIPEGERKCALNNNAWIRRWKLVEFLSVRRFYLKQKEKKALPEHRTLPESVVYDILINAVPSSGSIPKWSDVKKSMTEALSREGFLSLEKSGNDAVQKSWNKDQQEALKDLISPVAGKLKRRASLCEASAKKLYMIATQNEGCFIPELMEQKKSLCGLYERRQEISLYGGVYPQVSTLLGTAGKKKGSSSLEQKTTGILQKIFKELKENKKIGKDTPDYVVVECIRSAARSEQEQKEIAEKNKKNRDKKERLVKQYKVSSLSRNQWFRLLLWQQQGGTSSQPATCPFTGKKLPDEGPFSSKLELAHIFPESKGGIFITDNLVLTTREINLAMRDRTPVKAADDGIFGISSEEMLNLSKRFRWNEDKRRFFAHGSNGETSFPDFNNLTRVSQLASQLRKQIAFWLGIMNDAEQQRKRIGLPHGQYTAAMRRSLLEESKDRDTHTHHREDAALLSCIPPEGMNSVLYNGIFFLRKTPFLDEQGELKHGKTMFCLSSEDGVPLPDLKSYLMDETECPVIKKRSSSKYKSLGDSTFWRVDAEGHTWQRTSLSLNEKTSPDSILKSLRDTGISEEMLPSLKEIEHWIMRRTPATKDAICPDIPLLLKNGTPVKSVWKKDGKGALTESPMGWSAIIDANGTFREARKLYGTNDRLELWIGWNGDKKKQCWEYQSRVVPTREAMKGLKRMGISWRSSHGLPAFLKRKLKENEVSSLKELICGKLLPHSRHVLNIRKGMTARMEFKYAKEEKSELMWGEVSAVNTNGQLEFSSLLSKATKKAHATSPGKIAGLFGLPPAEEYARKHGLKP